MININDGIYDSWCKAELRDDEKFICASRANWNWPTNFYQKGFFRGLFEYKCIVVLTDKRIYFINLGINLSKKKVFVLDLNNIKINLSSEWVNRHYYCITSSDSKYPINFTAVPVSLGIKNNNYKLFNEQMNKLK